MIGRKPKPMAANYEQAVVDHIIDLVVEDGRPVALIEVIPEFSNEPPYLLIENVAVLPDWHGKGIGDWMLGHADSIALSLRFTELRLYTNAMFATNIAFYGRRGFTEFLRERNARGEVIHMKKRSNCECRAETEQGRYGRQSNIRTVHRVSRLQVSVVG